VKHGQHKQDKTNYKLGQQMKKTAAIVLAGAMVMQCVYAQSSVTIYGILDSGILYKTHAAVGGSSWSAGTGIESVDRWGLRGAADLGGGLSATFGLENGFRINSGSGVVQNRPNLGDTDERRRPAC
jgi:predicted porin